MELTVLSTDETLAVYLLCVSHNLSALWVLRTPQQTTPLTWVGVSLLYFSVFDTEEKHWNLESKDLGTSACSTAY